MRRIGLAGRGQPDRLSFELVFAGARAGNAFSIMSALHWILETYRRSRRGALRSRRSRGLRGVVLAAAFVLWLSLYAGGNSAGTDDRLEPYSFGNIGERRLSEKYPALNDLLVNGHVIPGLQSGFVPQGVDFLGSDTREAVLSGYFCEDFTRWWQSFIRRCVQKRSAFYLYDLEAREAVRLALLEERDGEPMRRHAGGVAELYGRLWLPDNFVVFRFDLSELRGAEERVITMRPENDRRIGVDSSGDFITSFEGSLWIGNFQRGRRGRPLPAHYRSLLTGTEGWTAGYRIDPDTLRPTSRARYGVSFGSKEYDVYRPDAALHHRNKVQGLNFLDGQRVVLSTSFGRSFSVLAFHGVAAGTSADNAAQDVEVTLPDGSPLQVRTLGTSTQQKLIAAPPGAEGVAYDGTMLAVAFEGGAMPYRQRWRWIEDRVLLFLPPEPPQPPER